MFQHRLAADAVTLCQFSDLHAPDVVDAKTFDLFLSKTPLTLLEGPFLGCSAPLIGH
jgi:hypothetical protein